MGQLRITIAASALATFISAGLFASDGRSDGVPSLSEKRTIDDYVIEVFGAFEHRDPRSKQRVRVSRNGQTLVTVEDTALSIDPGFGIPTEDNKPSPDKPAFGESISGNGLPDLLVWDYNNNAYGYSTLHIYELGTEFRTLYNQGDWVYDLKRTGSDRDWKIISGDEAGYGGDWGHVWGGTPVIVGFDPTAHRYRLAMALMRKPRPTKQELADLAAKVRNDERWDYDNHSLILAQDIFDLIYSGNGSSVDELMELAWNPKFPSPTKAQYKAELIENLHDSSWWQDIAEMNRWPSDYRPTTNPEK